MNKAKLTINGKAYDAYVSMYVLSEVCDVYDLDGIAEVGTNIQTKPFKWLPVVMYEGICYDYLKRGEVMELTKWDVFEWLDEKTLEDKEVMNFIEVMTKSLNKHIPQIEGDEGAKKK